LPVAALIALAIGGVATLFIVSQWVPVLLIRTAFWATLPLTVAVAIGLAEIPWRWLRYSLLVLLLIIEANGLRHWIPLRDVDHWPEATAWTLQLKDRPLVVAQDEVVAVPLQYYCRKAAGAACPLRVRVVDQPEPAWSRGVTGYPRSDVRQALDAAYTEGRFVALNWKMHDLTADIVRDGRFRRAARFGDAGGAETELWVARR